MIEAMKQLLKERTLLRAAVRDLNTELRALQASQREIERKLNKDSSQLDKVKDQEIKWRNLISQSMKTEADLLKKKNKAKDKLAELNKKIDRVKSIERELEEM